MTLSRPLLGRFVFFAALGLADLGLTCYLLAASGGFVYESNPLAGWWLDHWGWAGLVAFKLGLLAVAIGAVAAIARYRPRAALHVLSFSCLATLAVVLYSCTLFRSIPWYAGTFPLYDDATLTVQGRSLDERLEHIKAYRTVLDRASEDFLAGRCTLDEAVARLAATERERDPNWRAMQRESYPGYSDAQRLATSVLERACALMRDKPPGATPQRAARLSRPRAAAAVAAEQFSHSPGALQ